MATGRMNLMHGHTIISRAAPPHPQDVYYIYPPTSQAPVYVVELREVIFQKDSRGGFALESGRRRKHQEVYQTIEAVAQNYDIDSAEWQIMP